MGASAVNSNSYPNPWQLVGLADPDAITLEDRALQDLYKKFCSSLNILEGGKAIAAHEFLGVFKDQEPDFTSLKLMTALFHPNRLQMEKIRELTMVNPAYTSQMDGVLKYDLDVARALREMGTFRAQGDFQKLTQGTLPARTLLQHKSALEWALCSKWLLTLEASVFNKDWAILMAYGDQEDSAWNSFPYVAGFVGVEDLSRNVAIILASLRGDEPCRLWVHGDLPIVWDFFGCQEWESELLAICLGKGLLWGRYSVNDYGRELLRMTNQELVLARKQFRTLYKLVEQIEEIVQLLIELGELKECAGDEVESSHVKNVMEHLISRYGRPNYLGYFQKIHRDLLDRKKALEEEEEQLREVELLYDRALRRSAPALSPYEFPPDMKLRHLTPLQMGSLENWMAQLPGIRNPKLYLGRGMLKFVFRIVWEDQEGTQRRSFSEVFTLTVQEAFRQALGELMPAAPSSADAPPQKH